MDLPRGSSDKRASQDRQTFLFIGVTTSRSSIIRVFPQWMAELGMPEVHIDGVDLAIHDRPQRYRQVVDRIRHDPLCRGALVTTHKIDLFDAAHDAFDYLGRYARICGEVSCISKRDNSLEGTALDPIAAGKSLDAVLGQHYFGRTGGEVLCFGAGGAATAIALHLINKTDPRDQPARFTVVNRSPGRLEKLQNMVQNTETRIGFEYLCSTDPRTNDALLGRMPPCTLVINATGMGKDRPGSPVTDAAVFPNRAVAWELNYRGELDFMHRALAQPERREIVVEDGWRYFLHGWTQAIQQVLKVELSEPCFSRLSEVAAQVR